MTGRASHWLGAVRTAIVLATVFLSIINPASAHGGKRTLKVHEGQSIQRAINKAHPGDCIVVEKGTYREQLTITTDNIDLIGYGAILSPPEKAKKNLCTGLAPSILDPNITTQAGICVHGYKVEFERGPIDEHRKVRKVGRPVKGVSISGFDIQDFSGLNIAIVGGKDTRVYKNKLSNSFVYGSLTVGSKSTKIYDNIVSAENNFFFIGICMDDKSDVHVTKNKISGYSIGLCVQTNGADVSNNEVSQSCSGVFVDPGVVGAKVLYNYIHSPNPLCVPAFKFPAVVGIVVSGADNTLVKGNRVEGEDTGIVVVDDDTGKVKEAVAEDNKIVENNLLKNTLGIFVNTTSTDNVFRRNKCKTSSPGGLCVLK
jgi:hypothetical protein